MQLTSISITDFKNIAQASLELSPRLNGFLGLNGMGKSNLLDAVYCLSFTKSFTGLTDRQLIRRGCGFFMLRGAYERRGLPEEVTLGLVDGRRKSLKCKGKEYRRVAEHIGAYPLVMCSPADVELVRGAPAERRRWIDMVISQGDAPYLDALIRYNAALEQRNRLLRDGADPASTYLEVLDMTLDAAGALIHERRAAHVKAISGLFARYHALVGAEQEAPSLTYDSALNAPGVTMATLLEAHRQRDALLRHTSAGLHRDDILMELDGMPVRGVASEGQSKTFAIALRLAQYDYLRQATGMKPLLLLDDIFDKLDAERVERIVRLVTSDDFGQIFVTDTNRTHLDEIFGHATAGAVRLWNVERGTFTPMAT